LVRAYSAAVKVAIEKISLNDFIESSCLQLSIPFQFESNVRHQLATLNLTVIDSKYSENVLIEINVPKSILDSLQKKVNDITKGAARFDIK
jgi:putative IMPACT (imprinted ancient) family translation regulator